MMNFSSSWTNEAPNNSKTHFAIALELYLHDDNERYNLISECKQIMQTLTCDHSRALFCDFTTLPLARNHLKFVLDYEVLALVTSSTR